MNKTNTMIDSAILSQDDIQYFEEQNDSHTLNVVKNIVKIRKLDITRSGQDRDNPDIAASGQDRDNTDTEAYDEIQQQQHIGPNIHKTHISSTPAQSDSGANRIVTDDITLLSNVQMIDPYPMGGCNKNDPAAIICTAIGNLQLTAVDGTKIKVKAYFSEQVDGTIISPTTIVVQHKEKFVGWLQHAQVETNQGTIKLLGRNGQEDLTFSIYMSNDLWYHEQKSIGNTQPKVNRMMNNSANYELWHQRLVHPGFSTMECMHHHAKGVPKLKGNAFYACPSCMPEKLNIKRKYGKNKTKSRRSSVAEEIINQQSKLQDQEEDLIIPDAQPGQHFHMDFGFVLGKGYSTKHGDKTITSIDGKNAYLIVVDRATRYQWTFTTDNKSPPIEIIERLLMKFKSKNPHRTVRVDQGGELGRSQQFMTMITSVVIY
jgi:hypothetical protein